jgi:uncharacterized protein YkwD
MTLLACLALAVLTLAGCAMFESPAPQIPPPPDPKAQMGALENRIAILVEEERRRLDPKARPLAIDPELSQVARARANDMAAQNYLAHAAPNGDTSATLLMKQDEQWQGLLGENLAAQHYTKQAGVAVEDFARRFLDEWLKSPPHKENMVFANYDHAGVGAAVNGDTVYVAVLFSTDLGLKRLGTGASTVTSLENPGAAGAPESKLRPDSSQPVLSPPRLRGSEGMR